MTIIYVPVNAENEARHKQQMKKVSQLFVEGWQTQGILELKDNLNQKVNVMVFFKEE